MKRVLEDELISLAHRILKLKNRADIHQLKNEAGMLYEKLAVLSFAEKHFGGIRPTIGKKEFTEAYYSQYSDIGEDGSYNSPDGTEYNPEPISEPNTEKIKDIVSHMPPEAEQVDYLISQFKKLATDDFKAAETEATEQKEAKTTTREELPQENASDKSLKADEPEAGETKETLEDSPVEEKSISEEELAQENTTEESLNEDESETDETKEIEEGSAVEEKGTSKEEELPRETMHEESPEGLQKEAPKRTASYEEDFGVHFDDLPNFEPKKENKQESATQASEDPKITEKPEHTETTDTPTQEEQTQPESIDQQQPKRTIDLFTQDKKSLNDQLQRGIQIGLNDRLAFTKALFENNVEDYNRVMSQISTLNSFAEAEDFINYNVKPEYQNWDDKPEVYKRFLSLLKRKFEA